MKNIAPVRRELGVRTIFNILGPLTNPAGAPNILMGVFHPDLVGIQVRVMQRLGAEHALVVYGKDGMDEISLGAATLVGELRDGKVREYEIHPEDFGMQMVANRNLRVERSGGKPPQMLLGVLDNEPGAARDIVLLNAGAALYAANVVESIADGMAPRARGASRPARRRAKLDELVARDADRPPRTPRDGRQAGHARTGDETASVPRHPGPNHRRQARGSRRGAGQRCRWPRCAPRPNRAPSPRAAS